MESSATARRAPTGIVRPSAVDACFDLLATRRARPPEERLLLALLLDAIIQLQRRGSTNAAAAASWIRGDDGMGDATVAFHDVCGVLGVDADTLARGLLRGHIGAPPAPRGDQVRARAIARRRRPAARALPRAFLAGGPVLLPSMLALHVLQRGPWWLWIAAITGIPLGVGVLSRFVFS